MSMEPRLFLIASFSFQPYQRQKSIPSGRRHERLLRRIILEIGDNTTARKSRRAAGRKGSTCRSGTATHQLHDKHCKRNRRKKNTKKYMPYIITSIRHIAKLLAQKLVHFADRTHPVQLFLMLERLWLRQGWIAAPHYRRCEIAVIRPEASE